MKQFFSNVNKRPLIFAFMALSFTIHYAQTNSPRLNASQTDSLIASLYKPNPCKLVREFSEGKSLIAETFEQNGLYAYVRKYFLSGKLKEHGLIYSAENYSGPAGIWKYFNEAGKLGEEINFQDGAVVWYDSLFKAKYERVEALRKKAENFLKKRLGISFFKKYLKLDYNASSYYCGKIQKARSWLEYPDEDGNFEGTLYYRIVFNDSISFALAPIVVNELEPARFFDDTPLPDCAQHPELCEFKTNYQAAMKVANKWAFPLTEMNLEPQKKGWKWTFTRLKIDEPGHKEGIILSVNALTGKADTSMGFASSESHALPPYPYKNATAEAPKPLGKKKIIFDDMQITLPANWIFVTEKFSNRASKQYFAKGNLSFDYEVYYSYEPRQIEQIEKDEVLEVKEECPTYVYPNLKVNPSDLEIQLHKKMCEEIEKKARECWQQVEKRKRERDSMRLAIAEQVKMQKEKNKKFEEEFLAAFKDHKLQGREIKASVEFSKTNTYSFRISVIDWPGNNERVYIFSANKLSEEQLKECLSELQNLQFQYY